jgi:arginase
MRSSSIVRISLLGVCSNLGQRLKGPELAPQTLRESSLVKKLAELHPGLADIGDIAPKINESSNIWHLMQQLREKACEVMSNGQALITIGGDHSIAIATVQATLLNHPDARLIWIDAHGDINTPETSKSGNLHGMPLAALIGLFKTPIGGPLLNPENLLIVGVRNLDIAEELFLKELKVKTITSAEIRSEPEESLSRVENWIQKKSSPIHLSFDIDAIDPEFAPATGLHVPNGISVLFAQQLVRQITTTGDVISIDFVEFNPLQAHSPKELQRTIECATTIIQEAAKGIE